LQTVHAAVGSYSSTLTVTAGEVLDYEIVLGLRTPTAFNSNYTAVTMTQVIGNTANREKDGFDVFAFDLGESTGQALQANFTSTGNLASHPTTVATTTYSQSWAVGTGANNGELVHRGNGNNDVSYVVGVHGAGLYTAAVPEVVYTGNQNSPSSGNPTFQYALLQVPGSLPSGTTTSSLFIQAHTPSFEGDTGAATVNGSFAVKYNNGSVVLGLSQAPGGSENATNTDPGICLHGLTLIAVGSSISPPVITLGADQGYTSVGTLAVVKQGSTYLGSKINNITTAPGEATISGFSAGDKEIYFLALKTGGTSGTLLNSTATDAFISAASLPAGYSVEDLESTGDTATLTALASIGGSTSTYDLALIGSPGTVPAFLGFNMNGYLSGGSAVSVTDLAAVPEPGSIAAVVLGAGTLLLGRRRRKAQA
jgi:hypothetical protein